MFSVLRVANHYRRPEEFDVFWYLGRRSCFFWTEMPGIWCVGTWPVAVTVFGIQIRFVMLCSPPPRRSTVLPFVIEPLTTLSEDVCALVLWQVTQCFADSFLTGKISTSQNCALYIYLYFKPAWHPFLFSCFTASLNFFYAETLFSALNKNAPIDRSGVKIQ